MNIEPIAIHPEEEEEIQSIVILPENDKDDEEGDIWLLKELMQQEYPKRKKSPVNDPNRNRMAISRDAIRRAIDKKA